MRGGWELRELVLEEHASIKEYMLCSGNWPHVVIILQTVDRGPIKGRLFI